MFDFAYVCLCFFMKVELERSNTGIEAEVVNYSRVKEWMSGCMIHHTLIGDTLVVWTCPPFYNTQESTISMGNPPIKWEDRCVDNARPPKSKILYYFISVSILVFYSILYIINYTALLLQDCGHLKSSVSEFTGRKSLTDYKNVLIFHYFLYAVTLIYHFAVQSGSGPGHVTNTLANRC